VSHESQGTAPAESANPQSRSTGRAAVTGRKSAYFWGAATGIAFTLFAPMFRPAARSAVKGGIRVGRYAKKVASNVKEEFEDIAMEAQADVDREDNTEKGTSKT